MTDIKITSEKAYSQTNYLLLKSSMNYCGPLSLG